MGHRSALGGLIAAVVVASPLGLASPRVDATTCDPIGERIELEFLAATRDGQREASAPVELFSLRELVAISEGGVLAWEGETPDDRSSGLVYVIESEIEPTADVHDYLDETAEKRARSVGCPPQPYLVARPGVYSFAREHGLEVARAIEDPVLTIAADRELVSVAFALDGEAWVVDHAVTDVDLAGCGGCTVTRDGRGSIVALALLVIIGVLRPRRAAARDPPSASMNALTPASPRRAAAPTSARTRGTRAARSR